MRYTPAIRQLSADFDCYLCNSSTSIFVSDLDFSLYLSTAILTGKKNRKVKRHVRRWNEQLIIPLVIDGQNQDVR